VERKVVDNPERGRFEIYDGDEVAGFAEYHLHGTEIAFLHTEVANSFEGHGLGGTLARHALDDARERDRAVLPYCPFIRGWITRHPEYVDLVPAGHRARFGWDIHL
jgi:predicted GNAT family acetyltransferase